MKKKRLMERQTRWNYNPLADTDHMTETEINFLRDYLASTDAPCPGCGYNLRALTGAQCPECGDDIKLQVGLAEPRLAANIAGLIGLAAGGGFNALLLIYWILINLFRRRFGGDHQFLLINLVEFTVEGLALLAWLRFWRDIRRAQSTRRWLLVMACWLLALANIIVFSFYVG